MYNIPVLLLIFNRPASTEKVFEAIRKQRPEKLYIAADGPRKNKPDDAELCEKARQIVSQIDWDCELKTLFRDTNLGSKYAVSSAISWLFENEELGIILEDDCVPGESFFMFCEELLLTYKDDSRIMHITGSNLNDAKKFGDASYFYSKYPNVWGWATWKRAWNKYDLELNDFKKYNDLTKKEFKYISERLFWQSRLGLVRANIVDAWDYQWMFTIWKENGICLNSNYNLVLNIGFGEDATHTTGKSPYLSPEIKQLEQIVHPKIFHINSKADTEFVRLLHGIRRNGYFIYYLKKYFVQRILNLLHKIQLRIQRPVE